MISGGDVLEWPVELQSDKEMEMEQTFDEAMWEQDLEQGPPQNDDIVWLKHAAYKIGLLVAKDIVRTPKLDRDKLFRSIMERLGQL